MHNCPDCNGLGFIAEGYDGTDMLSCHFCGSTGRVDMDAYLNDMEAAFTAPVTTATEALLAEDIPI